MSTKIFRSNQAMVACINRYNSTYIAVSTKFTHTNISYYTYHNGLCQYCPTLKSIRVTPWIYIIFFIIQL